VKPDVEDQQQEPAEVIQPGKCLAGSGRNPIFLAMGRMSNAIKKHALSAGFCRGGWSLEMLVCAYAGAG